MSILNFSGVEEAKGSSMTPPGTIDVFNIKEIKFDASKNKGTAYLEVTFTRKQDSFRHSFYLTEGALGRLVHLVKKVTGLADLPDNATEAQLEAMLKGKNVGLKVTGKINEENGKVYADLPFGGFAKAPAEVGELVFSAKEEDLVQKCIQAMISGDVKDADGPTTLTAGSPTPAAPAPSGSDDSPFL